MLLRSTSLLPPSGGSPTWTQRAAKEAFIREQMSSELDQGWRAGCSVTLWKCCWAAESSAPQLTHRDGESPRSAASMGPIQPCGNDPVPVQLTISGQNCTQTHPIWSSWKSVSLRNGQRPPMGSDKRFWGDFQPSFTAKVALTSRRWVLPGILPNSFFNTHTYILFAR